MVRKATEGEMEQVHRMLEAAGRSTENISTDDVIVAHSPSMFILRGILGGGKEGNARAIRKAGADPRNPKLMFFMKPRLPNKTLPCHRMIAVTRAVGSLIYDREGLIPRALIKWDSSGLGACLRRLLPSACADRVIGNGLSSRHETTYLRASFERRRA